MTPNVELAIKWAKIAIARHERHMAGQEPTTGSDGEISQRLMMEEMKYSLKALETGKVTTGIFYDNNINKFPAKNSDSNKM